MNRFLFILLSFFPLCILAQVQKERRVYYLDCSFSMVNPNGINLTVCGNLMSAIDQIEDPSTELLVIPFAFNNSQNAVLKPFKENATPQGKANLKNAINKINWGNNKTMTYLKDPIEDFYQNRILDGGITYMFLMTDGQDEYKQDPNKYLRDLGEWGNHTYGKDVYGFYVMLSNSARNPKVEKIVGSQPFFWVVETADVNIKLARVAKEATFNIRNEQYLELPIQGKSTGFNVKATTEDPDFSVEQIELKDDTLKLYFNSTQPLANSPEQKDLEVALTAINKDQFAFWLTDTIKVTIKNKKEPTLKIRIE